MRYQVSPHNPFALLAAIGEDCPGAVQIVPPDRDLKAREGVKWLKPGELEKRIVALKNDAGAGRLEGDTGQFSLPGSQEKTALYRVNNRWGVPQGRTPTTHILKPETGRVLNVACNEHFCLQLARRCGLPAALSEVQIIAGIPVIVIERFDRLRSGKVVRRIHQEDMCQALGMRKKYQQEGGPGIWSIMGLLQFSDRPEVDRDRFMRAQAFNYLIAGTDAHARNYAIAHAPGGAFRLAPLYDVISDLPYKKQGRSKSALAMTIAGSARSATSCPGTGKSRPRQSAIPKTRCLATSEISWRSCRMPPPWSASSVSRRTCGLRLWKSSRERFPIDAGDWLNTTALKGPTRAPDPEPGQRCEQAGTLKPRGRP
jgi:serine/threonine-protein kinase HipA